jgi:hypothetical protein
MKIVDTTKLQGAVDRHTRLSEKRLALEREKSELVKAIDQARATGNPNDLEFVRKYGDMKGRLELFGSQFPAIDAELASLVEEIQAELQKVAVEGARAAGEQRKQTAEQIEQFLRSVILDRPFEVERLTREILAVATKAVQAETRANQFSAMAISVGTQPGSLLGAARSALRTFSK